MEKYQQGKVYAIVCRKTGRRYVGSTVEPTLARRLTKHLGAFKCWLKHGKCYKTSFDIIKDGDYYIVLLELCPCGSKDELRMCEQKHLDACECVNQVKAFQTDEERKEYVKQYNEQNHNKLLEQQKQNYEKKCDEINAKRRERVYCPHCENEFSKGYLSNHIKTCKKNITLNI
jgi:hypothetical protein